MRKLLILLVIIVAAASVYYYFNPQIAQQLPQPIRDTLPVTGETTAYKWRDAQGRWQITGSPPESGIPYETITVTHDTNVMPAEAFTGKKAD